jgi:hypothetical protein
VKLFYRRRHVFIFDCRFPVADFALRRVPS